MKKSYCFVCGKYRKFKCDSEDEKILKERESIEIFNWKYIITLKIWLKKT